MKIIPLSGGLTMVAVTALSVNINPKVYPAVDKIYDPRHAYNSYVAFGSLFLSVW
jgi:hypothetical protein